MKTHHISLYHTKNNQPESTVIKQELITYQQTTSGINITKLERSFRGGDHLDSYTSSPIVLQKISTEGQHQMDQEHNDNLDETEKIVRWTMRGIDAAGQKQAEHDPMGDDKVRYIKPPCPYVHYLMVEFNWSRSKAEFIAGITQ